MRYNVAFFILQKNVRKFLKCKTAWQEWKKCFYIYGCWPSKDRWL